MEQAPGANPLTVAQRVRDLMPELRKQLPEGLDGHIPYDASVFIEDSINEVFKTLVEAVAIVLVVIYLSLGSMRAAIVPAVAVPLSLVGAAFLMLLMGFSVNLLTLLAMVLAIGLVVDDAIIVVENVHRHIEQGESRFDAALVGARELALPIIAMTTTLVAVYVPIGFMGGLVGTLFTEFAFALAGAVLVSGVVALTLSPMLSSKVLKPYGKQGRFEEWVEHWFGRLADRYRRFLHGALEYLPVTMVFAVTVLVSIVFMFITSKNELAPVEDQSILFFQATAPQTATIEYNEAYTRQIVEAFESVPEYHESFFLLGRGEPTTTFGGFKMQPPSLRPRSQMEVQPEVQNKLQQIAGFQIAVFPRPSLPGSGGGVPVQFVIKSEGGYEELDQVADQLVGRAMGSGRFMFLMKELQYSRPRATVVIDRDRAGDLGISMQDIGRNLGTLLGGNDVNRFSLEGRSYKVIPQVAREFRLQPDMLKDYYIRPASGELVNLAAGVSSTDLARDLDAAPLVPLDAFIHLEEHVEPNQRTQFQQLNSLTVQGVMAPGVPLGDALEYLEGGGAGDLSARFQLGLCGRLAPVCAAGQRPDRHFLPVHSGDLPGAGRAVRELARSGDHPGVGAHVHRRGAGLHHPGVRHHQHLYPGGADHADRSDRQERYPDCRVCQPAADSRRAEQACRGGACSSDSPAAHSDDDRIHDCRHGAAAHRQRPGRREPFSHRPDHRHRSGHRHPVYVVRGAGGVSADGARARSRQRAAVGAGRLNGTLRVATGRQRSSTVTIPAL